MNIAPSAAPSDAVAPWIWDPTHSHSSGVPTHRTEAADEHDQHHEDRAGPGSQHVAHLRPQRSGRRAGPRPRPRPPANGQPEESLTCHQPISMPIRPSRGLTCHTPQPGSPMSLAGDAHEAVACRARAASARAAGGSRPARRPARRSSARAAAGARRARRGRARARRGRAAAAAPALRATAGQPAHRERGHERVRELALEPRDLLAQRAARRALVVLDDRRLGSAGTARHCGGWSASRSSIAPSLWRRGTAYHRHYRPRTLALRRWRGPRRTTHSASSTWIAGTPSTPTANSVERVVRGADPWPGATSPNSSAWTRSRVGDHEAARRQRALGARRSESRSSRPSGCRGRRRRRARRRAPTPARRSRSARSAARRRPGWRAESAVQQPRDRRLLARDPVDVGVEPDLAEERPVGVRDRLRPHRDDAGAAVAVRELLEPPLDVARAADRSRPRRSPSRAAGPGTRPRTAGSTNPAAAPSSARLAHAWPRSSACTCGASAAGSEPVVADQAVGTIPPRYASSTIGQISTPYSVADRAVAS